MRQIETLITISVLTLVICILVIAGPLPSAIRVMVGLSVFLFLLHVRFEGIHWQMFPIYCAGLLIAVPALSENPAGAPRRIFAVLAGLALIAGAGCCWALPMFHLPRPTGTYPIGTKTLHFSDPARLETHPGATPGHREVVAQFWYPSATGRGPKARYRSRRETEPRSTYQAVLRTHSIEDAPLAGGRFPVLIFNHTWRGFRNRSTFLAQELASHGFVVAALAHPYNCTVVPLSGGTLARFDGQVDIGDFNGEPHVPLARRLEVAEAELRIQVDDGSFVLDELAKLDRAEGHCFEGHLDLLRVGSYGHSFGGAVSAQHGLEDMRVWSVVELDGVLHGEAAREGLSKPLLVLDSDTPFLAPAGNGETAPRVRDRVAMWHLIEGAKRATLERHGGYRVFVQGTNHENFSDKGFMSPWRALTGIGSLPQRRAAEIICAYTVTFFKFTLAQGSEGILAPGSQPFPEARLRVWRPVRHAVSA